MGPLYRVALKDNMMQNAVYARTALFKGVVGDQVDISDIKKRLRLIQRGIVDMTEWDSVSWGECIAYMEHIDAAYHNVCNGGDALIAVQSISSFVVNLGCIDADPA
jgi:hypothetical protein